VNFLQHQRTTLDESESNSSHYGDARLQDFIAKDTAVEQVGDASNVTAPSIEKVQGAIQEIRELTQQQVAKDSKQTPSQLTSRSLPATSRLGAEQANEEHYTADAKEDEEDEDNGDGSPATAFADQGTGKTGAGEFTENPGGAVVSIPLMSELQIDARLDKVLLEE